ncbi:hypothetical protein BDQ17DRAFT_462146 [Cyathus striatus]|nr:hypothetical protein BDQ17DRAFT_462146 [Cyathus striatus]
MDVGAGHPLLCVLHSLSQLLVLYVLFLVSDLLTPEQVVDVFTPTVAALVVLTWEWASAFPHELEWIWTRPITVVKCIYIYARYVGLVVQIVNCFYLFELFSTVPTPEHACRTWYIVLMFMGISLLLAIDFILMLRVYALYNKSTTVAIVMGTLGICQIILEILGIVRSMPHIPFDPICNSTDVPQELYYFVALEGLIQLVTWTLMFRRRVVLGSRSVGRIPLVELLVRDGTSVAVVTCAICFYNLPRTLHTGTIGVHLIFVWPITFFSGATCRLVMNMHCSELRPQPTSTEINLTSVFGITVDDP